VKLVKVLLGIGAGFGAGYLAVRTIEAAREWAEPAPAREKDAIAYARIRRAFDVVEALRNVTGLAAFAFGSLGEAADRATQWAPTWLRPSLYFTALSLASATVELPAAFVQDYTLERRFGLSDQSRHAWLIDYAKSAAIGAAMMAFVATLFGAAVRRAPKTWPLLASVGMFPLFVAGNLIVPLYVLPLFNSFEPVTGSLETRLRKLAWRFGVGDAEILRMDMSRQTRKANAFVTGIGHTHRVVLGDTLIDAFSEHEIEFVVAHELGHYVSKDTWRLIGIGELLAAFLFAIAYAAAPATQRDELRDRPLLIARLFATMLLATQALRPLLFAFSRSREWAADRFAIDATRDPAAGATAFRRLRDQNLADADPPAWYELFFSSHPSLKKRIAALENSNGAVQSS
jgi:STE24 endopeptidase